MFCYVLGVFSLLLGICTVLCYMLGVLAKSVINEARGRVAGMIGAKAEGS